MRTLRTSVLVLAGVLYTIGPRIQQKATRPAQYDPYLFPATTAFFGGILFTCVLYLSAPGIQRQHLEAKLGGLVLSLTLIQILCTVQIVLLGRFQAGGIDITVSTTLACLASLSLRRQKMSGKLEAVVLPIAVAGLNMHNLFPSERSLFTREACQLLFSQVIVGIVLSTILLRSEALFANPKVEQTTQDIELANGISRPDFEESGQSPSRTPFRVVALILLLPQLVLAGIIALFLDGTDPWTAPIGVLLPACLSASFMVVLCSHILLVRDSFDPGFTVSFMATLTILRAAFADALSVVQICACALILVACFRCYRNVGLPVKSMYMAVVALICTAQIAYLYGNQNILHPLTLLIRSSGNMLQTFQERERGIMSLDAALNDYMQRYNRTAPPAFDKWYHYARQRDALVISNFDQIERDLSPFWNIRPAEIRQRTYTAIQDRYNYVSPLRIRNGAVSAPPMEIPTHYWMLERLMEMMEDFVEFLPDMDIAINLNDEPRVLAQRHKTMPAKIPSVLNGNPTLKPEHWKEEIPFTDETPSSFHKVERKKENTFDHSTRFCPRRSLSKAYVFDRSFVTPKSDFVNNWQETLDICNQPQMKDSRGFFVSPSAYDATDELLPIFSQSKPSTFSDILLPSPWNFGDKVGPDTVDKFEWKDKWDRVYWRGSTTEGWAVGGTWRVMLRQRLVDLLGGAWTHVPSLVPATAQSYIGNDQKGYRSLNVNRRSLMDHLDPDVFFVNVERADDQDADEQRAHFHLQDPMEFKEHWKHRFLIDTDGAAFSGRFLPFLQSNSLPLKFTSVFTEWWTDRVFAYQHFVPVTTENIFSVLTYFIGLETGDRDKSAEAHQDEAKKIADQGLKWAKTVLRKEDMKIYLFRLLIEYGRLVDDDRDNLGYSS